MFNIPGITDIERVGRSVILPASFTGSPRDYNGNYMDAMAICREFRKFDLFITCTKNPKWKSVTRNIFSGQQPSDRPDIVNRVMNEVVRNMMTDFKKGSLGPAKAACNRGADERNVTCPYST
jgi:hypothetical protein